MRFAIYKTLHGYIFNYKGLLFSSTQVQDTTHFWPDHGGTAKLDTVRLVVKVGTSLIAPGGHIDTVRMRALVDQLDLSRHEYLIVSSGAIAAGMRSTR